MDTKKVLPIAQDSEPDQPPNSAETGSDQLPPADAATDPNSQETSGLASSKLLEKNVLVLVVDDSVDNVALLSLDLQQEGYRVVTASNGEEAVRVAFLMQPNIILMDIGMPLLDGLGAATKIRENETLRTVPIIAVTAFSTAGFRRAAYDVGFDGYLTKPIEFDQLHELINRLLA